MTAKHCTLLLFSFALLSFAKAQHRAADSAGAAKTLQLLLAVCKKVDFTNPKTTEAGIFYKAAPYIVYRGADKKRAWKSFANYRLAEDKRGVDEICIRINETINRDNSYKIIQYTTEKESEGTWHVLSARFKKDGVEKETAFAFLKIGKRFGLGDID
jgi:hypothetical protein